MITRESEMILNEKLKLNKLYLTFNGPRKHIAFCDYQEVC